MKYLLYLVFTCSIVDILLINYHIHIGTDVFMPGIYMVILVIINSYTALTTYIIHRYAWLEERPVLAYLMLVPCFLFLFIHLLALIVNIIA